MLKLVAILYPLVLFLIVGAVVTGGRLNPDPDWSGDFGALEWCGEQLCFMGIRPGVTTWTEATRILEPYGYQQLLSSAAGINGKTKRVEFLLVKDKNKVGWLSINYAGFANGATLKSVLARFGTPCRLNVTDEMLEILTLVYPQLAVGVPDTFGSVRSWVADNSYSTDAPIHITLRSDDNPCNPRFVWKGFQTYEYYYDAPNTYRGYAP